MSKVPCGGFYLDENFLGMNENDELSLIGGGEGKAYQQLVTDGDGGVKWEDRLAYDDSKLTIDYGDGELLAKVSDEIPSWVSAITSIKIWYSNGFFEDAQTLVDHGNGNFGVDGVFFIATDNVEFNGIVFPEKGVYFMFVPDEYYVSGIASVDSSTPDMTWDGNIGEIKKLDEKFLPDMNSIVIKSSTPDSTKKFKITVNDSGAISATEITT